MRLELDCRFNPNDFIRLSNIHNDNMDVVVSEHGKQNQIMIKKEEAIQIIEHLQKEFNLNGD